MRQRGKLKSQRQKQSRQSLPPEELQRSNAIHYERRIPLSQAAIMAASNLMSTQELHDEMQNNRSTPAENNPPIRLQAGTSSSSSAAIQNASDLLSDCDGGSSFSDDSLDRSVTRSPVKKKNHQRRQSGLPNEYIDNEEYYHIHVLNVNY
jgi:hypothetical protein